MADALGARVTAPSLTDDEGVFVLDLGEEFRFSPISVSKLLDHVETAAGEQRARALITKAPGKFWASGLDLEWLREHPEDTPELLGSLHELYARMLELPLVSVAAIQGHAFAAGAMFALAHDLRVMRADRGYFCLPEVDMGIRFSAGLADFVRARLPQPACHEAMVIGKRWGGSAALSAGIVDWAVAEDEVLLRARELAAQNSEKPRGTISEIRRVLYRDVIACLRDTELNRVDSSNFALALAGD
jgi:Delta3-Delta2-enoyl-CoA isomerase